jgi:hypothetical protein
MGKTDLVKDAPLWRRRVQTEHDQAMLAVEPYYRLTLLISGQTRPPPIFTEGLFEKAARHNGRVFQVLRNFERAQGKAGLPTTPEEIAFIKSMFIAHPGVERSKKTKQSGKKAEAADTAMSSGNSELEEVEPGSGVQQRPPAGLASPSGNQGKPRSSRRRLPQGLPPFLPRGW